MALTMENLAELLGQALEASTAQSATVALKTVMKDPEFVPALAKLLFTDPRPGCRQLAAVLLRKRVGKTWSRLDKAVQEDVKQGLMRRMTEEESPAVRMSLAYLVSALARIAQNDWGRELLDFLEKCSSSPNAEHREMSQMVFFGLLDTNEALMKTHRNELFRVFEKGLKDPESMKVRVAAMKGIEAMSLAAEVPEDHQLLRKLLQPMAAVIEEAVRLGQEDSVNYGLEILNDVAEVPEVLGDLEIPNMIRFMLALAGNKNLSVGVRELATNFMHLVGKVKPKAISKTPGLIQEIINVVVAMGAEPDPVDLDEEEMTPHRVAAQTLDSLAINLPAKLVFHPAVEALKPYTQSSNPLEKKAALVLLGIMAEGCESIMKRLLPELLPFVFSSFKDPSPVVRSAACICLGQMADYLQPEVMKFHQQVMECLVVGLKDSPTETVKQKICYAIELFCDNMENKDIVAYLPILVPVLLETFEVAQEFATKESAIGAIGSAAQTGSEAFEPYAAQVLDLVKKILQTTVSEAVPLRARATAVAGQLVSSLPTRITLAWREELVVRVLEGMNTDNTEIRENSYRFLAGLALAMKDDIAPLIPKVMPLALETITQSDGIETEYEEGEDIFDGLDEEEDEEDEKRIKGFQVRTGMLDEIEAAAEFLRVMFASLGNGLLVKVIPECMRVVAHLSQHFHTSVRSTAPLLVQAILGHVHRAFPTDWSAKAVVPAPNASVVAAQRVMGGWAPGLPTTCLLHRSTKMVWKECWMVIKDMLIRDEDKEVVSDTCRALGEMLELLGPDLLMPDEDVVDVQAVMIEQIHNLMDGKHNCQNFGEGIDEEDSRSAEEYLFEGMSQLVSGLAQVIGPPFVDIFDLMHPKLLRLACHNQSVAYRTIGLGCYGDIFRTMGSSATKYIPVLITPVLEGIAQTGDNSLRRNATFCAGVLISAAPALPEIQGNLVNFLKALHPLFVEADEANEEERCVIDNAAAAMGRIIRSVPAAQLPMDEIVPLVLKTLPMKSDMEECETSIKTLLHFYYGGCSQELLAKHQDQLVRALLHEVTNPNSGALPTTVEEGKAVAVKVVQSLGAMNPILAELAPHPRISSFIQAALAAPVSP